MGVRQSSVFRAVPVHFPTQVMKRKKGPEKTAPRTVFLVSYCKWRELAQARWGRYAYEWRSTFSWFISLEHGEGFGFWRLFLMSRRKMGVYRGPYGRNQDTTAGVPSFQELCSWTKYLKTMQGAVQVQVTLQLQASVQAAFLVETKQSCW